MRRFIARISLGALAIAMSGAALGNAVSPARADEDRPAYAHTLFAIVKQIHADQLVVQRRDGRSMSVDIAIARQAHRVGPLFVNRAVALHGDYDAAHAFHVVSITGAAGIKFTPAAWPHDE